MQSSGETAAPPENRTPRGRRAAEAAARVAARYANVPSYSEMLTREARAAVQAAEAASKAAQQAQAAFQYVLDGLEAANSAEQGWESESISERHAGPKIVPQPQKLPAQPQIHEQHQIHDQPQSHHQTAIAPGWQFASEAQPHQTTTSGVLPRYDRPSISEVHPGTEAQDEPAQPIYANLIEFPREMVATRRMRPRLAEGPLADAGSAPQLSIFEVDPSAISIQPSPATIDPPASPEWMRTDWSDMTLQPLPPSMSPSAQLPTLAVPTHDVEVQPRQPLADDFLEEAEPRPSRTIESAPIGRRLLAIVVDCTLIAAVLVAAATLAVLNLGELPGMRALEFSAALALLAIGVAYHGCFMILSRATPGMRYAGIELNSFSGYTTSRGQRCGRLLALLLSILPLGLGMVWAMFDEGQLTWHDRLSRTYLRKC